MSNTIQDQLNIANPNDLPSRFQQVKIGDVLAGLTPSKNERTSLTSGTAQEHDKAATILAVSTGGAGLTMVPDGVAPAAGEVAVAYDADTGVPTLTFNSAVTAYTTQEMALSAGLLAVLKTKI